MRVRYSSSALSDLADILAYISKESPEGARKVAKAIERTVSLAAFMPNLGRNVPGRPGRLSRTARPYPYRITYRVRGRELEVLAIVHTARDR